MSYAACVQMAQSQSLLQRLAACAAEQGNASPQNWAANNLFAMAADASLNWAAAWTYAQATATANVNPDTGGRDDVIGDDKLLTAVQAYKAKQGAGNDGWPSA